MCTAYFVFSLLASMVILQEVTGHGMLLDPPNRSSLWRFDPTAPTNYNDNELFCGGHSVQWNQNGGKCGVCGDNYADTIPRNNENTGKYGEGKVVATYKQGSSITVHVRLTTNHKGWFNYSLCELKDPSRPEPENCFEPLLLGDGSDNYEIDPEQKEFYNNVQLPVGLTCERCVLRWMYRTGNFWGTCNDGSTGLGCGEQETYRSCSDIAIK